MEMFEGVGRRSDQSTGSFLDIGQHSLNGRERNCLFRNDGDGGFTDVGFVTRRRPDRGRRGLSVLDYDRDGRLDLLIRNYRQPAQLLRNVGRPPLARPSGWSAALQPRRGRANPPRRDPDGAHDAHRHGRLGLPVGLRLVQHLGLGDRRARAPSRSDAVRRPPTLRDVPADRRWVLVEGEDDVTPDAARR